MKNSPIENVEDIFDLAGSKNYEKLFRINYHGRRLYIRPEPFAYFSGLTTALSDSTFNGDMESKIIKGWREKMIDSYGKQNTNDFIQATADFGTLLHQALVKIKEKGSIDWTEEKEEAEDYFRELFNTEDSGIIRRTVYEYQKHVASMMQFIHERVEKIHAIEVPAIWDAVKIATPIDLLCKCRQTPKGDAVDTVINIKTSSQVSESHMNQVACEFMMVKQTYGGDYEHAAIVRTKDWTEGKTPTYQYKYIDEVEAVERASECFDRLQLCLNSKASYYPEPSSKYFEGETKIGQEPTVVIKSLENEWSEYWMERQKTEEL